MTDKNDRNSVAPISNGGVVGGDLKTASTGYVLSNTTMSGKITCGDIDVDGVSLKKTLADIEERLAILRPNPQLESQWEELAAIRQEYLELERELIEKQRTFDILKKPE